MVAVFCFSPEEVELWTGQSTRRAGSPNFRQEGRSHETRTGGKFETSLWWDMFLFDRIKKPCTRIRWTSATCAHETLYYMFNVQNPHQDGCTSTLQGMFMLEKSFWLQWDSNPRPSDSLTVSALDGLMRKNCITFKFISMSEYLTSKDSLFFS